MKTEVEYIYESNEFEDYDLIKICTVKKDNDELYQILIYFYKEDKSGELILNRLLKPASILYVDDEVVSELYYVDGLYYNIEDFNDLSVNKEKGKKIKLLSDIDKEFK